MSPENSGFERFGPRRVPARDALIRRTAQEAYSWISPQLASERGGWGSALVNLIHPEGSTAELYESVAGRIDGENRAMLNRLYGMTGARLAESTVHYLAGGTNEVHTEVVEIPVGQHSKFEEITHGDMAGNEFIPIATSVYFTRDSRQ